MASKSGSPIFFALLPMLCVVGAATLGCASRFAANPRLIPVGHVDLKRLEGRYAYSVPRCDGGCPNVSFTEVFRGFGRIDSMASTPITDDVSATVAMRVVDDRHLKATIYQGTIAVSEQLLAGKVDDEGFFVLKRAYVFQTYAAPLLWGYGERDARLGLDARGNLAVDMNVGGTFVFLVLPFFGNGGPVWYTFDRRGQP
jgi:hypothetical protein